MSSADADAELGAIAPERAGEAGAAPEWSVLGRLEKTSIGVRGGGGIARLRRREPPGCFLYGPYWQLPSGGYRLNFRCRSGKPRMSSQPVLGVEVIAMNRVQLAWLDLTAEELQHETGSLEFAVPPPLGLGAGDEARLEFRFFHMGNADLTIAAVDLVGGGRSGAATGPGLENARPPRKNDNRQGHCGGNCRSPTGPRRMRARRRTALSAAAPRPLSDELSLSHRRAAYARAPGAGGRDRRPAPMAARRCAEVAVAAAGRIRQ